MTTPISACLIVRNEAANLRACLESIRPHVTELVIVDTGSTDETPDIARQYADIYRTFEWVDDFGAARNFAFSLARQPWLFWCDGDDIVHGAEKFAELCRKNDKERGERPCCILFEYVYRSDEFGNPLETQVRERLITPRDAFEWQDPIHESLVPQVPDLLMVESDAVRIVHHPQGKTRPLDRNLKILRALYEKHGLSNPRYVYYLAREYGVLGDIAQSIALHKSYIERSGNDDEACLSCLDVTKHYETWGDYESAIEWAFKAMRRREQWGEPYLALGRAHYRLAQRGGPDSKRNWERAVHFLRLGVSLPPTKSWLFINPLERSHEAHKFLNIALNNLGRVAEALESCKAGLAVRHDDDLAKNVKTYENYLARARIDGGLQALLANERIRPEQAAAVRRTLDAPQTERDPRLGATVEETQARLETAIFGAPTKPLDPGKLDIVFYVGQSVEPWTPETAAKNGIGGSETAVIEMSKRLAAAGHRVRVFGDIEQRDAGMTFDGVVYVQEKTFRGVTCDVLISSRRADAIDGHLCSARIKLVWVHDVHLGDLLTPNRALRTDRFLCLSQWHRDFFLHTYPFVHPEQVIVTRNGIDLKRFERTDIKRDPNKVIYSSSPDRGLLSLLQMWPRIHARVQDATLEVFYGFQTWEDCGGQSQAVAANTPNRLKEMLAQMRDIGVTHRGRCDQDTLARAMLSAGVWAYPTWFSETSCIGAMEAQAAGLRIVTSPIAALLETCRPAYCEFVPGDWLSENYQEYFIEAVVRAMNSRGGGPELDLSEMHREKFSWDSVAAEWLEMLPRLIAEVERDVMPKYQAWKAAE